MSTTILAPQIQRMVEMCTGKMCSVAIRNWLEKRDCTCLVEDGSLMPEFPGWKKIRSPSRLLLRSPESASPKADEIERILGLGLAPGGEMCPVLGYKLKQLRQLGNARFCDTAGMLLPPDGSDGGIDERVQCRVMGTHYPGLLREREDPGAGQGWPFKTWERDSRRQCSGIGVVDPSKWKDGKNEVAENSLLHPSAGISRSEPTCGWLVQSGLQFKKRSAEWGGKVQGLWRARELQLQLRLSSRETDEESGMQCSNGGQDRRRLKVSVRNKCGIQLWNLGLRNSGEHFVDSKRQHDPGATVPSRGKKRELGLQKQPALSAVADGGKRSIRDYIRHACLLSAPSTSVRKTFDTTAGFTPTAHANVKSHLEFWAFSGLWTCLDVEETWTRNAPRVTRQSFYLRRSLVNPEQQIAKITPRRRLEST
ncbi:hypothetical protein FB45DRAFT_1005100 [Roridomyces roridus]|uniref:Uncharacterized protein n=1 Tax=Roridomyces roridus TaxID=1738132 RepID=A0AAD7BND3_9AGAR|nr:hypothetical protein FB45DRAFT_1005100 [Roridomyces roridus]